MKYLLLLFSTIIAANCSTQKKTNSGYYIVGDPGESGSILGVGSKTFNTDSAKMLWATPTNQFNEFTITPRRDTAKVLMLVCDTTFVPNVTSIIFLSQITGFTDTIGYVQNRVPYTWWQFGYMVSSSTSESGLNEKQQDGSILIGRSTLSWSYLDQNKKPLPKSIIVWMTKEIK